MSCPQRSISFTCSARLRRGQRQALPVGIYEVNGVRTLNDTFAYLVLSFWVLYVQWLHVLLNVLPFLVLCHNKTIHFSL